MSSEQILLRVSAELGARIHKAAKAKRVGRQRLIMDVLDAILPPAGAKRAEYDQPLPGFAEPAPKAARRG